MLRKRDSNGRYKHWDNWERLCRCGHKLGDHTAAKVRGLRPCLISCTEPGTHCDCQVFRPAKEQPHVPIAR